MASLNVRLFPKSAKLLREGQMSDLCYFVLKGCVREYCLRDGLDRTIQIYTEGQPIAQPDGAAQRRRTLFGVYGRLRAQRRRPGR